MNRVKKIFGILLTLALVLTMNLNVFGALYGAIIVVNPREGQVYTAYQIFDVSYNADLSSYSYWIKGDSEWFDTVNGYAGITLEKNPDEDVYTVIENENYSAPEFAEVLKAAVDGKTGTDFSESEGQLMARVLMGYYFVKSTTGALCNLTTADPVSYIRDKNDLFFEKTDDAESVQVGQKVNYVVSGRVPETLGFSTYIYKISDTMSDGLTFNKDVKVYLGGAQMKSNYTLTNREDGTGFDLTIDVLQLADRAGETIEVKYSAKVNENAVGNVESNSAYLEYSNNPVDGTQTVRTTPEEETVYSAKIVIDKYEADNESKKLPYAYFVLLNSDGLFYRWDNTNKLVEWVADQKFAAVKRTDENGAAEFPGLADGSYQLKETISPAGYNLMTEPIEVTIDGGEATIENPSVLTQEVDVPNSAGTILPETGGIGTTIFYAAGIILVLGAAVLLLSRNSQQRR